MCGSDVIKQADHSDAFSGNGFGDESLLMHGTSNTNVRMVSDGALFCHDAQDFHELVALLCTSATSPRRCPQHAEGCYELYEEAYDDSYIPGAKLIPLPELRSCIGMLLGDQPKASNRRSHSGSKGATKFSVWLPQGWRRRSCQAVSIKRSIA